MIELELLEMAWSNYKRNVVHNEAEFIKTGNDTALNDYEQNVEKAINELMWKATCPDEPLENEFKVDPKSPELHKLGICVCCGVNTEGWYGRREEPDSISVCFDCYQGEKLVKWLEKRKS